MLDTALHLYVVLCVVCVEPTTSVEVWTPELSTEPESLNITIKTNNFNFNQLIIHKISHKITNIKFHAEHTKRDVSSNLSLKLE